MTRGHVEALCVAGRLARCAEIEIRLISASKEVFYYCCSGLVSFKSQGQKPRASRLRPQIGQSGDAVGHFQLCPHYLQKFGEPGGMGWPCGCCDQIAVNAGLLHGEFDIGAAGGESRRARQLDSSCSGVL